MLGVSVTLSIPVSPTIPASGTAESSRPLGGLPLSEGTGALPTTLDFLRQARLLAREPWIMSADACDQIVGVSPRDVWQKG